MKVKSAVSWLVAIVLGAVCWCMVRSIAGQDGNLVLDSVRVQTGLRGHQRHQWRAPAFHRQIFPSDFATYLPHLFGDPRSGGHRVEWHGRSPQLQVIRQVPGTLSLQGIAVRAFNAAMLVLRDGSLLSVFRIGTNFGCVSSSSVGQHTEGGSSMVHQLGVVRLDPHTFLPVAGTDAAVLHLPTRTSLGGDLRCDRPPMSPRTGTEALRAWKGAPAHVQDPRLFWWGPRLMLLVNVANCEPKWRSKGFWDKWESRLYLVELSQTTFQPIAIPIEVRRLKWEQAGGMTHERMQKNWSPFVAPLPPGSPAGAIPDLYLEHAVQPRNVLKLINKERVFMGDAGSVAQFRATRSTGLASPWLFLQQNKVTWVQ